MNTFSLLNNQYYYTALVNPSSAYVKVADHTVLSSSIPHYLCCLFLYLMDFQPNFGTVRDKSETRHRGGPKFYTS